MSAASPFLMNPFPPDDLAVASSHVDDATWARLDGKRIFITGGTGFVGKWLIATLLQTTSRLGIECRLVVLTRDSAKFARSTPWLAADPCIELLQGDVRDFSFPQGPIDIVIHGATDVELQASPLQTFETCVEGTRHVLELTRQRATTDFLLISSGAVYGSNSARANGVAEDFAGAPDSLSPKTGYGQGKRVAEWLTAAFSAETGMRAVHARLFALLGPGMPFGTRFAVGNFIRDALARSPIVILGDGTPIRSYLYAADMAGWIWKILLVGNDGEAYNVGGQRPISIAALAQLVTTVLESNVDIIIRGIPNPANPTADRYMPDTGKARQHLQLAETLSLEASVARTAGWCRETL